MEAENSPQIYGLIWMRCRRVSLDQERIMTAAGRFTGNDQLETANTVGIQLAALII